MRIVLSLAGVQRVSHARQALSLDATGGVGDVGVLPADAAVSTTVKGAADVVQVFVDPVVLDGVPIRTTGQDVLRAFQDEALMASTLRLFVTLHLGGGADRAADHLSATLREAIIRSNDAVLHPGRGGPRRSVMSWFDQLVATRIAGPDGLRPPVRDLASEAGTSGSHLARGAAQGGARPRISTSCR